MTAGKMKAMKTVEEMRKSVLAECETICPNVGDFSRVRLLWIGKIERTSEVGFDPHYDGKIWAIFAHGGGEILYFIHEDSDEAIIDFAYMLFGFAERDAVAELREESDKYFTELKAARERNAALVAAHKDIIRITNDGFKTHEEARTLARETSRNAIAANKKGGTND